MSLRLCAAAAWAAGCVHPTSAVTAFEPAAAGAFSKAVGTTQLVTVGPEGIVGAMPYGSGTAAQSGEGTLGDRVFRLGEHGLLEGCRYVASGRICELVTTPDGSVLGGALHWIIPDGAPATPRAGGWVMRTVAVTLNPQSTMVIGSAGELFYCRFGDDGPSCLRAPDIGLPFDVLAAMSVQRGSVVRDVVWFQTIPLVFGFTPATQPPTVHRCETDEDATEVFCAIAALP